jgi:putative membrane protein
MMKKTLVLVVDRDDDFGVKGDIETPVIGVEGCSIAATALGIADPEDSDINALYAAINIYKEIRAEGNTEVEVALIGGNEKVGHRSDAAIVDELEEVLRRVSPDRVILVGDGAEDEYVYPIISSRVPIDSVKKVYVKQVPGLEGTVYIVSKILEDPAKRKRFLAPLGWIIVLISLVYIIPPVAAYMAYMGEGTSFSNITTAFVIFLIGVFVLLYAYNAPDYIALWRTKLVAGIRGGSVIVPFGLVSMIFVVVGLIIGYLSLENIYIPSLYLSALWFVSNALWLMIFALLVYRVGDLADMYISTKRIKLSFIIGSINLVALGLIATGTLDVILTYFDLGMKNTILFTTEIMIGLCLALLSALLQRHLKDAIVAAETTKDAETDAA